MKLLNAIFSGSILLSAVGTQMGGCSTFSDSSPSSSDGSVDTVAIPRSARLMREGTSSIEFAAHDGGGHVYAYDVDARTVVDDREIRDGQKYVVNADSNRITLDGKKVFDGDLKRKHTHRIYFVGDRRDDRNNHDDDRNARLPRSAKQVVDGRGQLTYTPRDDGRVYVYDEDADRVVFDHRLRDGQHLDIDADKDRITIDGKSAFDGDLVKKHSFRIYFDRD